MAFTPKINTLCGLLVVYMVTLALVALAQPEQAQPGDDYCLPCDLYLLSDHTTIPTSTTTASTMSITKKVVAIKKAGAKATKLHGAIKQISKKDIRATAKAGGKKAIKSVATKFLKVRKPKRPVKEEINEAVAEHVEAPPPAAAPMAVTAYEAEWARKVEDRLAALEAHTAQFNQDTDELADRVEELEKEVGELMDEDDDEPTASNTIRNSLLV